MSNITLSGKAMSWGLGGMVCSFLIYHQCSPLCCQVEVSIESSLTNFLDDLEGVKHHNEEASYGAVLAVLHRHVLPLLYRLDYKIYAHFLFPI